MHATVIFFLSCVVLNSKKRQYLALDDSFHIDNFVTSSTSDLTWRWCFSLLSLHFFSTGNARIQRKFWMFFSVHLCLKYHGFVNPSLLAALCSTLKKQLEKAYLSIMCFGMNLTVQVFPVALPFSATQPSSPFFLSLFFSFRDVLVSRVFQVLW